MIQVDFNEISRFKEAEKQKRSGEKSWDEVKTSMIKD